MPHSNRPGDVLADRYRLVDLLSESRGGRFWRAHDRVLARHIALHVIPADDDRASMLLEAARRSATVADTRLLRVLDADEVDGICYVVNEWGSGTSLDIMLANDGPLTPRRAAWLVSEVGDTIASAHEAGIAHGRLVPENVLIDHNGSVRLIGFAVDAALHGLPESRGSTDVVDLASLLYAALVGKWPGISRSQVPPAPHDNGRVLRPRKVRAGIPKPLDAICDQVINPYGTHGSHTGDHDFDSARSIVDALLAFVGNPAQMAAAEAAREAKPQHRALPLVAPDPPSPTPAPPTPALTPEVERTAETPQVEHTAVIEPTAPAPEPTTPPVKDGPADSSPPDVPSRPTDVETQAGMPVFYDEIDDVGWMMARSDKPPPPPPFEEAPPKPLFAPDPPPGEPVRKPRPGTPTGNGDGFWPWDTGTGHTPPQEEPEEDDDTVPGRNWLRLAAVIGVSLLLVFAVLLAFNFGNDPSTPEDEPDDTQSSTTPSGQAGAAIKVAGVKDFDPEATPPEENPDTVANVIDGKPETTWRTSGYNQNFGDGGIKSGVGVLLDLGSVQEVGSVDLTLVGEPTGVSLFATDSDAAPTAVDGLQQIAQGTADGTSFTLEPEEKVSARYVLVWLTSLPPSGGRFRGEIAEVGVRS